VSSDALEQRYLVTILNGDFAGIGEEDVIEIPEKPHLTKPGANPSHGLAMAEKRAGTARQANVFPAIG
jgi:hypothetical protein